MGSLAYQMHVDVVGLVHFTILSTHKHVCWATLLMERSTASGALGSTACKQSIGCHSVLDNLVEQASHCLKRC